MRPILAVDFDGTITADNDFPNLGPVNKNCKEVLQRLHKWGCIIILWTCRGDHYLTDAVEYCREHQIPIDYVNENCPEVAFPAYPKIFANYYIDDLNIGGPLSWLEVERIVMQHPYIQEQIERGITCTTAENANNLTPGR
jgi:hydroxymethylpyrimidine pyrophosphatase-like HAD family hydrolase